MIHWHRQSWWGSSKRYRQLGSSFCLSLKYMVYLPVKVEGMSMETLSHACFNLNNPVGHGFSPRKMIENVHQISIYLWHRTGSFTTELLSLMLFDCGLTCQRLLVFPFLLFLKILKLVFCFVLFLFSRHSQEFLQYVCWVSRTTSVHIVENNWG